MTPLDAGFLLLEDRHTSLHIGSVAVFDGPVPRQGEVRDLFARTLHLVPRYRQRMRRVPLALGRPVWVDDPAFDLDFHLRRTAVTAPGGDEQLQRLVGRLMSQRLDPDHPLWESWIVEGLRAGRWAMVSKLHHSMVDGIAGLDVLSTILDDAPEVVRHPPVDWHPAAEPSTLAVLRSALSARGTAVRRGVRGVTGLARHPRQALTDAAATAGGLRHFATAARPITASSLAGPIGSARRFRWACVDLADVAAVRDVLGGSVNDVVLAIVTRALRDLLIGRDEAAGVHAVRCLVPVSVRAPDEHGHTDNRVSALLLDLPVEFGDPLTRYQAVVSRMRRLKASHEVEAGEAVTELAELIPPPLLNAALWLAFRVPQRALTTVVTNVPGPRGPLYAVGRRMVAHYPYVPIADQVRVGVAVTSYDGRLYFGVTCDRGSVPDADAIAGGIVDGLAELAARAAAVKQEA
jgi:diacylglycerol O-acyltransferase